MINPDDSTTLRTLSSNLSLSYNIGYVVGIPLCKSKSNFKFKKNDTARFKFKGKEMTGKITKIGVYGVDVKSNNGYYYLTGFNSGEFKKASHTKNYR